jgi:hypothetical protein
LKLSVSTGAASSRSADSMKTLEPPAEAPANCAGVSTLPPLGLTEWIVVVSSVRSYTSATASVSDDTSFSVVWKKTLLPSCDMPSNDAGWAPLPPPGPVDTSVVVPPARR